VVGRAAWGPPGHGPELEIEVGKGEPSDVDAEAGVVDDWSIEPGAVNVIVIVAVVEVESIV
jgi:hypothetical protein